MNNNKSGKTSVEKVYSVFEQTELFVLDFSALMFMADDRLLQWLAESVSKGGKKVAVCKEFYRCYSIVAKSGNAKQKEIARNARKFVGEIKKQGALVNDSKFRTNDALARGLHANPRVTFIVGELSEAAEAICSYPDSRANIFAVTYEGKFYCASSADFRERRMNEVNADPDNSKVIRINIIPDTGDAVKTNQGELFVLKKRLSKGAEGTVFLTDNNKYVCKIYNKGQMTVMRCRKLKLFEERLVEYEGICWPEKTVYNSDGLPVGYIMKKVKGKTVSSVFDGDEEVLANFPSWKRSDLIEVATGILERIRYLHLLGVIVGDIRPKNIIIAPDGAVSLIDMDSCQINDFPCPCGDEDFTPPENQGKPFSSFLRTYENEKFSCAVMVFEILFLGVHPYARKNGAETMAEEIASRSFPYPKQNGGESPDAPDGGYGMIWNHLPRPLCEMFYGVFKEDKRPGLTEWLMMLDSYKEYLDGNCKDDDPLQRVSYYGYEAVQTAAEKVPAVINETETAVEQKTKKKNNLLFITASILIFILLFIATVYVFLCIDYYCTNGDIDLILPITDFINKIKLLSGG